MAVAERLSAKDNAASDEVRRELTALNPVRGVRKQKQVMIRSLAIAILAPHWPLDAPCWLHVAGLILLGAFKMLTLLDCF